MGIEEILLIMDYGPGSHDGAAARHDSCEALANHIGMGAERACMDGEIVHTLFGLLYEGIAVYLP